MLSTELAILMPFLVVVALVGVYVVQVQRHGSRTQAAADAAARAASYSTTYGPATDAAAMNAAARICNGPVEVDLDWIPPDELNLRPGRVVVEVRCQQTFTGFVALVDDPVRTASATGVAAVEYWRQT